MRKRMHKVRICIADKCGNNKQEVLQSEYIKLRERVAKWLFGDFCEVIIFNHEKKFLGVEIKEVMQEE